MKVNQFKTLLKHIILEIQKNEMIANKNVPPDVMGAVNVEETFENIPKNVITPQQTQTIDVLLKRGFKLVKTVPLKDTQVSVILELPYGRTMVGGSRTARVEPNGRINTEKLDVGKVGEQTGTGAVAGFQAPMRRKKVKEYTNKDGTYKNDMPDAIRMKKAEGLSEMTTSSAAGGQEGGTIKVPAWGTKNKEGSTGAIAATKKMKGWTVAKSISTEGK